MINQDLVNASGGFPFKIRSPGSYKLTSNLILPTTGPLGGAGVTAIEVDVNNVTIDLNGFTIVGVFGSEPGTVGISSTNNDITVRNGSVNSNGGAGLALSGVDDRVEQVQAIGNGGGEGSFGIECGNGCTLKGNIVDSANGIGCGNNCLVEDNVIEPTFQAAFSRLGSSCLILGNTIGGGLILGSNCGYTHNTLSGTPAGGISLGGNVCGGSLC